MKSPLYLTENLSGGELPLVLWHWHVGLLSPPQKKKKKKENRFQKQTWPRSCNEEMDW
jgi:hypothetical protein